MPLFHQHPTTYSPDQAFTNLFRLIDGFDAYSREVGNDAAAGNSKVVTRGQPGTTTSLRAFNPRFDVHETETSYELHGELPGLDRNNITIEFSDPQTLVVSGRIERNYEEEQPEEKATPANGTPASPSLKATVADEETEKAASGAVVGNGESKKEVAPSTAKPVRYWYRERSIGSFRRAFEFPSTVNEDAVKAGLDNGVLNISIPKAAKRQTKKINLS